MYYKTLCQNRTVLKEEKKEEEETSSNLGHAIALFYVPAWPSERSRLPVSHLTAFSPPRATDPRKHFPEHLPRVPCPRAPKPRRPAPKRQEPRSAAGCPPAARRMASAARGRVKRGPRDSSPHSDGAAPRGRGAPPPPTLARRHRAPLRSGTALPRLLLLVFVISAKDFPSRCSVSAGLPRICESKHNLARLPPVRGLIGSL